MINKIFIFSFVFLLTSTGKMDYKVLNWSEATEKKNDKNTTFYRSIDFNLSTVYKLKDSSYLVMPLNPFGNSLLTKDKENIDKWIKESYFPSEDEVNKFYFDNKEEINNIEKYKEKLKQDVIDFYYKDSLHSFKDIKIEEIDQIYSHLKKSKKLAKFKLHFLVLAGDFAINELGQDNYKWGQMESKQLLNPLRYLVLISKNEKQNYYNLEEGIFGKYGFFGTKNLISDIKNSNKKLNEFQTIVD